MLTTREAARILGITKEGVRWLCREGTLKAVKQTRAPGIAGNDTYWQIDEASMELYLQKRKQSTWTTKK